MRVPLRMVVLTAVALHGPLAAQGLDDLDRARGRIMLRVVREHLERHYYDSTFHGINLRAAAARVDSLMQAAQSNSDILALIAQFVLVLDDSHTRFYPPARAAKLEYGWELQMIGDSCYVVGVAPEGDAARQGLNAGDRVLAMDGYVPSRRHFGLLRYFYRALSPRPAVQLVVETPEGLHRSSEIHAKITERPQRLDLSGDGLLVLIRESEDTERQWRDDFVRVGDDVLVWRMSSFDDESEIDRAMRRARGVDHLILDLRGNPGGLEDALLRLIGHFFDRRVVVGQIRRRREVRVLESRPVGRPFAGRLYVLLDSRSASASEAFAHVVQREGRGMVLGDLSAGHVMRGRTFPLSMGADVRIFYGLSITDAELIMADGTRLERRGVRPDTLILPTAADLAAGRDPVLAAALSLAGYQMDPAGAAALLPPRDRLW